MLLECEQHSVKMGFFLGGGGGAVSIIHLCFLWIPFLLVSVSRPFVSVVSVVSTVSFRRFRFGVSAFSTCQIFEREDTGHAYAWCNIHCRSSR